MIRTTTLITLSALALAACEPETIDGNKRPDPMADQLANAAPVELPPAIAASKTYRCKDNSLVQIDWLAQDKGAYVHGNGQEQTHLKPAEPVEGTSVQSGKLPQASAVFADVIGMVRVQCPAIQMRQRAEWPPAGVSLWNNSGRPRGRPEFVCTGIELRAAAGLQSRHEISRRFDRSSPRMHSRRLCGARGGAKPSCVH